MWDCTRLKVTSWNSAALALEVDCDNCLHRFSIITYTHTWPCDPLFAKALQVFMHCNMNKSCQPTKLCSKFVRYRIKSSVLMKWYLCSLFCSPVLVFLQLCRSHSLCSSYWLSFYFHDDACYNTVDNTGHDGNNHRAYRVSGWPLFVSFCAHCMHY